MNSQQVENYKIKNKDVTNDSKSRFSMSEE
jgi:hypothetical protein